MKSNQIQPADEIIELNEIERYGGHSSTRGESDGSIAIDKWITIGDKRRAFGMTTNSSNDPITFPDQIRQRAAKMQQVQEGEQTPYDKVKNNLHFKINKLTHSIDDQFEKFDIFSRPINQIISNSGYGIGVVFKLMRWMFLLSLVKMLIISLFLILPQLIHRGQCSSENLHREEFTALSLITGRGFMEQSEFFYGSYYSLISSNDSDYYNCLYEPTIRYDMTGAYFYIFVLLFLFVGGLILKKTMRIYKTHYSFQTEEFHSRNTSKLFSVWDYNLTNEKTVRLKSTNIYYIIKDILKVQSSRSSHSYLRYLPIIAYYVIVTIICLLVLLGSCLFVYYQTMQNAFKASEQGHLLPCIYATMLIVLLPILFDLVMTFSIYKHEAFVIHFSVIYLVMLKVGIFLSALYPWITLTRCASKPEYTNDREIMCEFPNAPFKVDKVFITNNSLLYNCWETWIGQKFYTMFMLDIIGFILTSFILYASKWILHRISPRFHQPQFSIACHSLHIIYIQIICWCGMFYSPILPMFSCLYIFINFFVFKFVAIKLCQTYPKEIASFRAPFGIMIIVSALFVGSVSIMTILLYLNRPSEACGPFHGLATGFGASGIDFSQWKNVMLNNNALTVFSPVMDIFFNDSGLLYMLLLLIFWQFCKLREYSVGKEIIIKICRKNLTLIDRDKVYLMKRLNEAKSRSVQNVAHPRFPISSNVNDNNVDYQESYLVSTLQDETLDHCNINIEKSEQEDNNKNKKDNFSKIDEVENRNNENNEVLELQQEEIIEVKNSDNAPLQELQQDEITFSPNDNAQSAINGGHQTT